MKILCVDDDPIAGKLIAQILKSVGYSDLIIAASGADALEEIADAKLPFDCFILDIQLPEMDGIELCRRIRRMKNYKSSPILMATRMVERKFIDDAFSAGANDYINKPFDPLELCVRVQLAEKIVCQHRISASQDLAANSTKAELEKILRFSIREPVKIRDVPSMVEKLAMENYLLQLSGRKSDCSIVLGFAIKDFDSIFERSTPSNIYYMLTDVSNAIVANLTMANSLLSYFGLGLFACIITQDGNNYPDDLEFAIQSIIDDLEIEYNDGVPCEVRLLMGTSSKTSLWSPGRNLNALHSALESADAKRRETLTTNSAFSKRLSTRNSSAATTRVFR